MRIVRSAQAEEDLIGIWQYVAKESQHAADRLLEDLERRTNLLAQHPEMGRERPDIAAGLRYVPSGNYLILYRVVQDRVEIVRYVHGRRNLKHMA